MNADLEWLQSLASAGDVNAQSILGRLHRAAEGEAELTQGYVQMREIIYDVIANADLSREWWDGEGLDVELFDAVVSEFGEGD